MRFKIVVAILAILTSVSISSADIIGYNCIPDPTGATTASLAGWWENAQGEYVMHLSGGQSGADANVGANFTTDTPADPTIFVMNSINNDSSFAWNGYFVNVTMNNPFTLFSEQATLPPDWSASITIAPFMVSPGVWMGQILYQAGTTVNIGDEFDYQYKVSFSGSPSYSLNQEMIPVNVVPEPSALVLMAGGFLAMFLMRKRTV